MDLALGAGPARRRDARRRVGQRLEIGDVLAAWVASNGTHIHLLYDDAPTVAPRGHVAILADDYDATVAAVRDAGFDFRPDEELWGVPRGFVRTPTGHRVEIMSGPPPP